MKQYAMIGALTLAAACGSEEPANNSDAHANHTTNSVVDTYADGMMKIGEMAMLHVMLMAADPAPPDVGENTWMIRVLDADQNAVDDATVTVSPFMPAHGHGTSPADYTGAFTNDGTYEVGPFNLFMPGVWETTVKVDGDVEDVVTFSFELEG